MNRREKAKRIRKTHWIGELATLAIMLIVALIVGFIYGFDRNAILPEWFEVFRWVSWAIVTLFVFVQMYEDGVIKGYDAAITEKENN